MQKIFTAGRHPGRAGHAARRFADVSGWSVRTRILALVLLACGMLVLAAATAMYGLKLAGDSSRLLATGVLPRTAFISDARKSYQEMHATVYELVVSSEPEAVAEIEQRLKDLRQKVLKATKDYQELAAGEVDTALMDETRLKLISYLTVIDRIKLLASMGERELGLDALRREVLPAHKAVAEALDAVWRFNETQAGDEGRRAESLRDWTGRLMLGMALAGFAVIGVVGFVLGRSVLTPLGRMQHGIAQVAAELDFRKRIPVAGPSEIAATLHAYDGLLVRLQSSIADVRGGVTQVGALTGDIVDKAKDINRNCATQADASGQVASAVEQMAVSMATVGDQAAEAEDLSKKAEATARRSGEVVMRSAEGIQAIGQSVSVASQRLEALQQGSSDISQVARMIKEIAEQTNLLALNAAIEAARAGEQGRGFAVVADEVRKLAERTSQSTNTIETLVRQMETGAQSAADGMAAVVRDVGTEIDRTASVAEAIRDIKADAEQACNVVADISAAVREQGAAIAEIARQVEQIAQMTDSNFSLTNASEQLVGELLQRTEAIEGAVARYRI